MQLTPSLQNLLMWGVPKMLPEGEAKFRAMMEDAVRSVVVQAFDEKELAAFNVTTMTDNGSYLSSGKSR